MGGANIFQAGTLVGAPLPKTPKWQLSLSPRYETRLGNGGSLAFLADWSHTTSAWNDTARTYLLLRPTTNTVNASVTYREPNDHWTLTIGGTNLTDGRYLTSGGSNVSAGVFFGTYNRPREWYAKFGFRF